MTYLQGDIVLVSFPFTNQADSKPRPAIVVSNSKVNKSKDIILAQITTNLRADSFSYAVVDKMLTHSLRDNICEVRCHKLFIAEKSIILKKISALRVEFHQDFISRVLDLISVEE